MLAASVRAPQPNKRKGRTATVQPLQNSCNISNTADSKVGLRLQRLSALGIVGTRADFIAGLAWGGPMADVPFADHKAAALSLLLTGRDLTRKAGSFLGQCVVDATPLTTAQAAWLAALLDRAGLPPMKEGANNG